MNLKKIITIIGITSILFRPIVAQASEEEIMPNVGVSNIIEEVTIDQIKWAYAQAQREQLNPDELRLMSAIIWCEAGNQCTAGKQAVGIIVMNRVDNASFKDSVEEVIYETGQFRPKTDGRLNKALKMYDNGELPVECITAAMYALSGQTTVIYNEQEIDMSEYLYFARHWKNAQIRIEDHDFR